jgi:hypothetical protein
VIAGLAGAVLALSAAAAVLGAPPKACLATGMIAWLAALLGARRTPALLVLGVALAARLPFAFSDFLTDDLHRYVWEARVILAGFDPYELAPDAPELAHLADESHALINHPSYRSIYPPLSQLLFTAVAAAGGRELALRNVLIGIDVLAVAVLLLWRRALGRPPGFALAYAWCPVAVLSAGSGHVDPLALFLLAGVGLSLARGRAAAAGALLALATLAKLFPVLLLPWLLRRRPARAASVFTATVAAGALAVPWGGLAAPLGAFAYDFSFNAPLFGAVRDHLPGSPHAWVGTALLAWVALAAIVEPRFERGALLVLIGLLALSPTVHFWYLTWVLLPAAAVLPAQVAWPAVAWAAGTVALYRTYAEAYVGGPFLEHRELTQLAVLPAVTATLAVVVLARLRRQRPRPPAQDPPPPPRFAVVIPAYGEVENLRRLLPAWLATAATRIVVADTPTGDGTRELVDALPRARYVEVDRPGYGAAVLAGLDAARDLDVAVVCDADHLVGPEQARAILAPFADPRVGLVCAARGPRSAQTLPQRLGNALVTALIAWRFGRWYADLGPFRALRLRCWPPRSLVDGGFGINVEMNVRALRAEMLVVEVALDTMQRQHGVDRISTSLSGVLGAGKGMLLRLFALSEEACAPRSSS